jgi:acid phosphatase type 7
MVRPAALVAIAALLPLALAILAGASASPSSSNYVDRALFDARQIAAEKDARARRGMRDPAHISLLERVGARKERARSQTATFSSPEQVHLALRASTESGELAVAWRVEKAPASNFALFSGASFAPAEAMQRGDGSTSVFNATATCATYHIEGGYTCSAVMPLMRAAGLKPGQKFFYAVGSTGAFSRVFSAVVPKTRDASIQNGFKVAMKGDEGLLESFFTLPRVNDLATTGAVDWVYHVGDIGYANDYAEKLSHLDKNIYEWVWDEYMTRIEPATTAVPYMTCPGNHEWDCSSQVCNWFAANFSAYRNRFAMPRVGTEWTKNGTNMWFSFDYGSVHFVSISTESDFKGQPFPDHFGDQVAWLDQDLARARKDPKTQFIVVIGHRPLYCSNKEYSSSTGLPIGVYRSIQLSFEELFHKYDVELFMVGHVHAYERTHPTYKSKISPGATTYIVNGAAGNQEGLDDWPWSWHTPRPVWSAKVHYFETGFGVLSVEGSKADPKQAQLVWRYYASFTGDLLDEHVISVGKKLL